MPRSLLSRLGPPLMFATILLVGGWAWAFMGPGSLPAGSFDHSHAGLDSLLRKYVHAGGVDYVGLQQDRRDLQDYLTTLGDLNEDTYQQAFTRDQQLALLINAYNAFTLELILDHYPVDSIRDIPGNWTEPRWRLFGSFISLDSLENKIIRPDFAEPRIHFALVCAARGCPVLRPEAYVDSNLGAQLASAARGYARDPHFNRLDKADDTLYVSKIFEWYSEDFATTWGDFPLPAGQASMPAERGIVGFFVNHLPAEDAEYLRTNPVEVVYLPYDWELNTWVRD